MGMSNIDQLEQRVEAVENAVTDGKTEFEDLGEIAELTAELESVASRLEKMERRLAAVEGATQSLEGYVGNVRSVNRETEKQADAAVAAVDRLESKIETFERQVSVEAFESLAQRVEELDRDQQRLAEELSQSSGTTGEFVFGGGEQRGNGHSEGDVSTNGSAPSNGSEPAEHANGGRPIDPAATDRNRTQQHERDERLPPQQQRVDDRYGATADADEEQTEEKGTMAKLAESLPSWMTK